MKIIYCCKDCGNKIGYNSANYGNGRCKPCYLLLQVGENNPNYIDGRSLKEYFCINCYKKISYSTGFYGKKQCHSCAMKGKKHYNYIDGKYCKQNYCDCGYHISVLATKCKSCANKKENNPNWQNGISKLPYSFIFTEDLKLKIRERDNFICQNPECNINEERHIKYFNRKLAIHHIDYNKLNCDENNLITLCNRCNCVANGNRNYWYAFYTYILENK